MSNRKAFFHSLQTCDLIGRSEHIHVCDVTMMAQEHNKLEMLGNWSGNFHSNQLKWEKWSTDLVVHLLQKISVSNPHAPFLFQLVKEKILAKMVGFPVINVFHAAPLNKVIVLFKTLSGSFNLCTIKSILNYKC